MCNFSDHKENNADENSLYDEREISIYDFFNFEFDKHIQRIEKRRKRNNEEDKVYFEIWRRISEVERDKAFLDQCVVTSKYRIMVNILLEFLDRKFDNENHDSD